MIYTSASMQQVSQYMQRAANSDSTVLITGETGTGKELAAEFIHQKSRRATKAFVCVNCAAIPDSLLESELFGHVKGAFTGAEEPRQGLVAAANGGTLFLDEIGDMSLSAQRKVLRLIEKREVCHLGGTRQIALDVRFVAATNQDLESMTGEGTFRKDLFFRLNVVRVRLPPLRERRDDIPPLVRHYLSEFSLRSGVPAPRISDECLRRLVQHDWPGNVRELKNVIEGLFLTDTRPQLQADDLPDYLRKQSDGQKSERDLLLEALFACQWNKSKAAQRLHWSRMTLYRKLVKYQIEDVPPDGNTL
jgi:two-component system response regulator HydG/two-component system response regulator AtoC